MWRLVTVQNGVESVSTVPLLDDDDVAASLAADVLLHRAGGWTVTEGDGVIVCRRFACKTRRGIPLPACERIIFARAYDPARDGEPLSGV